MSKSEEKPGGCSEDRSLLPLEGSVIVWAFPHLETGFTPKVPAPSKSNLHKSYCTPLPHTHTRPKVSHCLRRIRFLFTRFLLPYRFLPSRTIYSLRNATICLLLSAVRARTPQAELRVPGYSPSPRNHPGLFYCVGNTICRNPHHRARMFWCSSSTHCAVRYATPAGPCVGRECSAKANIVVKGIPNRTMTIEFRDEEHARKKAL